MFKSQPSSMLCALCVCIQMCVCQIPFCSGTNLWHLFKPCLSNLDYSLTLDWIFSYVLMSYDEFDIFFNAYTMIKITLLLVWTYIFLWFVVDLEFKSCLTIECLNCGRAGVVFKFVTVVYITLNFHWQNVRVLWPRFLAFD